MSDKTNKIKQALAEQGHNNAQEVKGEERFNYIMPTLEKMYAEINPNLVTLKNGVIYFNSNQDSNDNAYPIQLSDLMKEASSTHSACIQLRKDLTVGNGLQPVDVSPETQEFLEHVNRMGDDWQKIWDKISYDYQVHGMFALQVLYNREGKIVEVYHMDITTVRAKSLEENEDFLPHTKTWLLSRKWAKISTQNRYTASNSAIEISNFNPENWAKDGGRQLLVCKKYQSGNDVYGLPHYQAVLNYIQLDHELAKYHLNKVSGGFFPNVIVQLAGSPSDEQKQEFKNKFNRHYKGSDKEKILFIWNEGDDTEPKIIPFDAAADTSIFETLNNITTQKILTAHQTMPELASMPSQSASLGGDANKINVSRAFMIETVIKPIQKIMLQEVNKVFKQNELSPVEVLNEALKLDQEEVDKSGGNAPSVE